ncbi:hypothetical protein LWI29_037333 [Acer saccharum]|uniref:Uncharacterized protein n=1 Tax=Acer saccharum TaxID=4024 RepID=A0AA39RJV5_ACESA|nr:hypothetical protein LWI29_037333 [Acer saccharum]
MDSLIKLTRFSSAGQGNTEEVYSSKDQRIPPQRSLSFKTEKKRAQNWFRRQFSRNMSRDYDSEYQREHVTAVAAAAYAIKSLQDSSMPDQKKTSGASESPLTRLRSRKEDDTPGPSGVSNRFSRSGENATSSLSADSKMPVYAAMDEKQTGPPTIKKRPTFAEDDEHLNSPDTTRSKRTPDPSASSIKKTPTFVADERLNSPSADTTKSTRAPSMKKTTTLSGELKNSTSGEIPAGVVQKTDTPPTKLGRAASKPDVPPPAPPTETRRRTGVNQTAADVWEKAELEKIKERELLDFLTTELTISLSSTAPPPSFFFWRLSPVILTQKAVLCSRWLSVLFVVSSSARDDWAFFLRSSYSAGRLLRVFRNHCFSWFRLD